MPNAKLYPQTKASDKNVAKEAKFRQIWSHCFQVEMR